MPNTEADVIIVGGGPVGLTLATDLSCRGVKTILLERKKSTSVIAKAIAVNLRTMEHFRRMGVEKKLQDVSLPRDLPFNVGFYTTILNGRTNFKRTFGTWGSIADGSIADKPYPFHETGVSPSIPMWCPQSSSEPVLKEHLETTSPCVTLLFGHRVTSITQDDNEVVVTACTEGDQEEGVQQVYKAKYVVACDGGSSPSRKLLGVHMSGKFVVGRACSIMINSPQMFEQIKSESKTGFSLVSNEYLEAVVVTTDGQGGMVLHLFMPASTSDEDVKKYEKNPIDTVKKAIGSDLPFTVLGASSYNMHALVSTKFRAGRVLFAGDSAHQWLPVGGLGLNTGVSDVGNLAWKLEAVVNGFGGCNLLESYEEERRPQVDSTRRFVMYIGQDALFGESKARSIVQRIVFSFPVTRFIVGQIFKRFARPSRFESNHLTLGFQYSNSSIIMHEYSESGEIVTSASYGGCRYPALPGCRAPHVILPDAESILDLFGKTFVLLVIGGEGTDLIALKEELEKKKIPFQVFTYPRLPELVAGYDRKYFLVRPDGVICWRSDTQPSSFEAEKIAATVIGDVKRSRLPMPIVKPGKLAASQSSSFVFDLLVRFGMEAVLINHFQLSYLASWAISLGCFLLLRAWRTRPPVQFIQNTSRHRAVVLQEFGDADAVLELDDRHIGSFGPRDVLIRVYAASVNPIDCRIREGYGSTMLAKMLSQTRKSLFPLVLGRDCSGEVVAVGDSVTKFLPGDRVYAAVPPYNQGTYTQLVAVNEDHVSFKPSNVDFKEAASLPWVACTTWSALVKSAGLTQFNTRGKKVLVHAGTGGVGSFAVQLLKAWGAEVTVTCSAQNVTLAHHLGADKVIDYSAGDFSTVLRGYDLVLDPIGLEYERKSLGVLKWFGGATYVSLISPKLWLADKLGPLFGGLVFSWLYRFKIAYSRLFFGRAFFYSMAAPDSECLNAVSKMVEKGKIKPIIEAVYSMDEIVAAHKHVESVHSCGKCVVPIP